jgi:arsenate reductase
MKQVPQRILFLCSHNAARSQMAEGLLRHLGHGQFAAFSAGTQATQVRPEAIAVMAELGIDISKQASKTLDRFLTEPFDEVICEVPLSSALSPLGVIQPASQLLVS